ncbi:DUF350 domain-containing protein [Streptomyces sp. TE5632]
MSGIVNGLGRTTAYGALGLVLLVLGIVLVETTYEDFGKGLVSTAAFGLLGLVMTAVAFLAVDLVTPGRLGAILVEPEPHPAVRMTASCNLAVSAVISASID